MSIQYVIAGVLIVGGAVTTWIGPDLEVRDDGTPIPPGERRWMRLFGVTLLLCGVVVLAATLLGFRAQPLKGQPAP